MKVVCTHCGLPFASSGAPSNRPVFCCSGCALAFEFNAGGGEDPSARRLLTGALGAVFLLFNQMLGAVLARLAPTGVFESVSFSLGLAAWAVVAVFQFRAGARGLRDMAVAGGCLAAWGAAVFVSNSGAAFVACAGFALWAARGVVGGKDARKK